MLNRRLFLSSAAALAVAGAGTAFAKTGPLFGFDPAQLLGRTRRAQDPEEVPLDPQVRTSRIAWLEQYTHEIDSIDLDDNEFEDLEAFGKAVGDARIVMLGEQLHGDGTTFRAKARLVRFLHEEMGFDVLAFESGFLGMRKVWQRIREGENARTAARSGLFDMWSRSRQVQPLIDYVGTRAHSSRPLELAGFDCQLTGSPSRDHPLSDLVNFLTSHDVDSASIANWPQFLDVFKKFAVPYNDPRHPPISSLAQADRDVLLSTLDALIARTAGMNGEEAAFWRQLFKSTKAQIQLRFGYDPENFTMTVTNVRDPAMANNLIWLAREAFPRRKIIVWAATFHNIRNPHLIETGLTTMGHLVWQAFGDAVYNVGFTAYEGSFGWFDWEQPVAMPPPSPDSLEGLWGETKHDNAFLDLRRLPAGGDWLRTPQVSQPRGYVPELADWSQVLDAMVFTRTMRPSTSAE